MYTIFEVTSSDIIKEHDLLSLYAKESKSKLVPEKNPDFMLYSNLEKLGMFKCFGLYKDNNMVGFITLLITTMPHYSKLAGTVESFYVSKEHRKFGTGKSLLATVEEYLKNLKVDTLFLSAPLDSRLAKANRLFGFKATHMTYIKAL